MALENSYVLKLPWDVFNRIGQVFVAGNVFNTRLLFFVPFKYSTHFNDFLFGILLIAENYM